MDLTELYANQGSVFIMIIGKSGRGKSASLRNLPPEETYLVNVVGKQLPFLGGSMKYRIGQNMSVASEAGSIQYDMQKASKDSKINYIVLDDIQYVMASEFMQKAMIKGYDKFTQMAKNIWDILLLGTKLRPGLKVFVLAHEEETQSGERKMKTLGKLLDEKLTPEGMSTIVLYADAEGEKDKRRFFFTTQSDGYTNAKSPMEMFPLRIPNDLKLVADRVDEYYSGVPLSESKLKFDL